MPAELRNGDGKVAAVKTGRDQHLLFRETDRPRPDYDGHHVQMYITDFSGPYRRLAARNLISREDNRQFDIGALVAAGNISVGAHQVTPFSEVIRGGLATLPGNLRFVRNASGSSRISSMMSRPSPSTPATSGADSANAGCVSPLSSPGPARASQTPAPCTWKDPSNDDFRGLMRYSCAPILEMATLLRPRQYLHAGKG
jgi:hypothetical protein